jgi:hypothetical protein
MLRIPCYRRQTRDSGPCRSFCGLQPVREVYLTSERSRRLKLGGQVVELRHVPAWQLVLPGSPAGGPIRALAWLGPKRASEALRTLQRKLSPSELRAVVGARGRLPTWMAQEVSALANNA